MRRLLAMVLAIAIPLTNAGAVIAAGSVLKASPATVSFGTKPVGLETLKSTRITNRSDTTINLIVTGGLPDDFGFGLLPGSTCPVLAPAPLAPHESCVAVVRFTPSEFFAGQRQTATLQATATDPVSGAEIETLLIDFTGTGR
jgi:hypothetical protein